MQTLILILITLLAVIQLGGRSNTDLCMLQRLL
jgi:hypothetical protein